MFARWKINCCSAQPTADAVRSDLQSARDKYLAAVAYVDPLKDDPDEQTIRQQEGVPLDQSGELAGQSDLIAAVTDQINTAIDAAYSIAATISPSGTIALVASISGCAHAGHLPDDCSESVTVSVDRVATT